MPPNLFREKLLIHESGFACGVQILDAGIVHRTPMSAHEASAPKMLGMDPDGRTFSSCSSKNRWKGRGLAAGLDAPQATEIVAVREESDIRGKAARGVSASSLAIHAPTPSG